MANTKAKFQVRSTQQDMYGGHSVNLTVVQGGSPENDQFFKATPQGELVLSGITAEVAATMAPGQYVYVTVEPVPVELQQAVASV